MSDWDIQHAEAMSVVSKAATHASDFQSDLKTLDTALAGLWSAVSKSQLVRYSLGEYVSKKASPQVDSILGHIDSGILGTRDAIEEYEAGDQQMAAEAIKNSQLAEYPIED